MECPLDESQRPPLTPLHEQSIKLPLKGSSFDSEENRSALFGTNPLRLKNTEGDARNRTGSSRARGHKPNHQACQPDFALQA